MVGTVEQGRISLHGTLQKQVSDHYSSPEKARNPFKEGKVFLAMFGIGIYSLLQVARSFLEQQAIRFSLVLCFSPSLSLLCFLVPNSCFVTGEKQRSNGGTRAEAKASLKTQPTLIKCSAKLVWFTQ